MLTRHRARGKHGWFVEEAAGSVAQAHQRAPDPLDEPNDGYKQTEHQDTGQDKGSDRFPDAESLDLAETDHENEQEPPRQGELQGEGRRKRDPQWHTRVQPRSRRGEEFPPDHKEIDTPDRR